MVFSLTILNLDPNAPQLICWSMAHPDLLCHFGSAAKAPQLPYSQLYAVRGPVTWNIKPWWVLEGPNKYWTCFDFFPFEQKNFSSKHNGTMMWFFCTNLNCDLILKITSMGFSDLCVTKFIPGNSVSLNLPLQTEKEKVGQLEISDVFRCFPNKPSCNALLHKLNYLNWSYFEVGLCVIQPYNSRGSMQVQPRHFGGLQ